MANVSALMTIFGVSSAEIARIAKTDKSAVVRWRSGERQMPAVYKERLYRAAQRRGLPESEVAWALDLPRCPACGTYHL
jgi:hypothetical protein